MASLWPWLAVAGVGALHGLNPATGWIFAAAWGMRSGDRAKALRALAPIAIGHATSIALVAGAVALGRPMDRTTLRVLAGGLLVLVAIVHLSGRTAKGARSPAGHAAMALWSFMMATAHGAGLMLVPALIPICVGDAQAREIAASRSLTLALVAVGVHSAAMLGVTGVMATGVCGGFELAAASLRRFGTRGAYRAEIGFRPAFEIAAAASGEARKRINARAASGSLAVVVNAAE